MREDRVRLIERLERLRDDDDRGALAALRRGLGKTPGSVVDMHRYVVPFLPEQADEWEEHTHYLVASLFAWHPDPGGEGTMGTVLARVAELSGSDSIERRFMALVNSHPDDLGEHLRHAVSLARSKGVPIDWHRLFRDVEGWPSPTRHVQKRWARDFWARREERPAEEDAEVSQEGRGEP